ncbi:divalent-cation tolerance protein CutA [Natrinema hispanicum]|uniref:Divalent cation tolerance protein n=1 Tax=Natrinema hispanicum TaxID=392421 RepID=A0A1G6MR58_9EURY|nr:divalent-cation tolerance protein CutA [Natrinema hispanicum]SDC58020.1 divalent cation tolerance protein [Natrinema hispanicum]SET68981.1 divalent cation tolerance protein [Natrinema hispanicum]
MPTVYITAPPEAADDIAKQLVDARLAACVNQFETTSTYRWEGDVHHDEEVILLAKTTGDASDDLVARVQELHPYDVPCIERFDECDVLESFAAWRADSVE